jgi:hypothetical protein
MSGGSQDSFALIETDGWPTFRADGFAATSRARESVFGIPRIWAEQLDAQNKHKAMKK